MPTKQKNKGITKKKIESSIKEIPEEISEELNEKQKAFCKEFCYDWNGTRAYKVAYGVTNDDTARANASALLTKANVKTFVKYLKENIAEACGVSVQMIVEEHKKMALSSISHLHNTWIERIEFEKLKTENPAILDCIQEIDYKTETKVRWEYNEDLEKKTPQEYEVKYVKLKLYSKQESLKEITKIIGGYSPDKVDLSNKDGSLNLGIYTNEQLLQRLALTKEIEQQEKK